MTLRIGILASSGGSVFLTARKLILQAWGDAPDFFVVTDRPCGAEVQCEKEGIPYKRITGSNTEISTAARDFFQENGHVDFIVLLFLKLVTKELFKTIPTFNIHPSLLPAYRGFNPIEKCQNDNGRYLGCTLHLTDDTVDGGPIVAQGVTPLTTNEDTEWLHKCSYLQKVYIFLLLFELFTNNDIKLNSNFGSVSLCQSLPIAHAFSPAIRDKRLLDAFLQYQETEGIKLV